MPKNRPQKGKVLMMWQLFYQRKEKSRGSINSSFTLTNNSDDIYMYTSILWETSSPSKPTSKY